MAIICNAFRRCCWPAETQDIDIIDVNDELKPLEEAPKRVGCMGRIWEWYEPTEAIIRGAYGVASLVATTVLGYYTAVQFCQDTSYHARGVLEGSFLGMAVTVLVGSALPTPVGVAVADWISRWSSEGMQLVTQFYLNAGSPIDGYGLWNTNKPPLAVKEAGMILFSAISSSIALLAMRSIAFPQHVPDEVQIQSVIDSDSDDGQDPEPIAICESGSKDTRWFIAEQVLKAVPGLLMLTLQKTGVLQDDEWLYLGYYLTGHTAGVVVEKIYHFVKDKVLDRCPVQKKVTDIVERISHIAMVSTIGLFFGMTDSTTFLALGGISGILKMVSLRKFERLKQNDETVEPFTCWRVDNLVKGFFLLSTIAWYVVGMTDKNMRPQDRANILIYMATSVAGYIATRYLAGNFDPRNNSRLFNTLRFYFVNYTEMLIVPYMFIRSAQEISDDSNDPQALVIAENAMAWASFGLATGNNRALLGIRGSQSPIEMSELALYVAWSILSSQRIR